MDILRDRLGLSETAYARLLDGDIPHGIATALGTSSAALQNLLNGDSESVGPDVLACSAASVSALRKCLGREAVLGLVIGLAAAASRHRAQPGGRMV